MAVFRSLLSLWRALRGRSAFERSMDEEFRFHVEERTRHLVRQGMSQHEAQRRARMEFGSVEQYKEEGRASRGLRWFDELRGDLRYAGRLFARSPGFAAVAIISLGLGIGASTAMYSVMDAVLLRPLPYPAADELVQVGERPYGGEGVWALSVADMEALQQARSFRAFGVYGGAQGGITWTRSGESERIDGTFVTPGLITALGMPPVLGTGLPEGSEREGAPAVVLLSHSFWSERLGADPSVLGRVLLLNEQPHTVVGIMPPEFSIPGLPDADLWPVLQTAVPEYRAPFWLRGIARLTSRGEQSRVRAELTSIENAVKARYAESPPEWNYVIEPLQSALVKDTRGTVLLLFGAVVLFLLIATGNVANLLLARASVRMPELAVRSALGAGRSRLGRQLLAESLLLAFAGALLGVALAWVGVRLLPSFAPPRLARLEAVQVDLRVLAFALGTSLVVGVLVGLLPALRLPQRAIGTLVRQGGRGGASGPGQRDARSALVIAEFALAVMVLIGAGLITNSLLRLQGEPSGASARDVVAIRFSLPQVRYDSAARINAFVDQLLADVRSAPGVQAAALGMAVPPHRLVMTNPFTPEGTSYAPGEQAPHAQELLTTPDYFETFGIRLLAGRDFTAFDTDSTPAVAIVNRKLAERYYPDGDAVGHWIQTGAPNPEAPRLTIVGVVEDVKYDGLESEVGPTIYVPYAQHTWWRTMYLGVRGGAPGDALRVAREALARTDPLIPVQQSWTMADLRSEATATPRFRAVLLASFALLSLVLAAVGIHGVMAYAVNQRRREAGIRMALGAAPAEIRCLILRDGLLLAGIGIVIGLAASLMLARFTVAFLFGVTSVDPATYASMVAVLVGVALVAILGPAIRATRTDLLTVLKTE
jgi:predicted permease